jgi:hypothetical protein
MKAEVRASLSAVAAVVMLVACASKGSVSPKPTDTAAQDETAAEYQRLVDNASQRLVCKRQAVLGTRVDSVVCVTEAEMKAQREQASDVMRDIQANAPMTRQPDRAPPPSPPPPRQ